MNRVTPATGRRAQVVILFLCVLVLVLCQVLGPSARLNRFFELPDPARPGVVTLSEHRSSAHTQPPSRCANIKLAPVEIRAADLAPTVTESGYIAAPGLLPLHDAELGVPTPPPRRA